MKINKNDAGDAMIELTLEEPLNRTEIEYIEAAMNKAVYEVMRAKHNNNVEKLKSTLKQRIKDHEYIRIDYHDVSKPYYLHVIGYSSNGHVVYEDNDQHTITIVKDLDYLVDRLYEKGQIDRIYQSNITTFKNEMFFKL